MADVPRTGVQADPMGVQLDRRFTRSAPLGTQEHLHIKRCLALEHVIDRPAQFMRQDAQGFALVMLFSNRASSFCPGSLLRRNRTAASEKAHLR